MLATHFNVTIFPWPKSDLKRSADVYSLADSGKTMASLKALLLPHDFVSESQDRSVKSLLPPQSHVDDRVFDELIGGNLREKIHIHFNPSKYFDSKTFYIPVSG